MPLYKLHYFNAKGFGETIRFIFAYSQTPYEDIRNTQEQFNAFRPKTPWGQAPVLECDGKFLGQRVAIARFMAKQSGLYGKNDWEAAQIDSVLAQIEDMLAPFGQIMGEKDPIKKGLLKKHFIEERFPTYLGTLEKYLADNKCSGHFVGNAFSVADFHFATEMDRVKGLGTELDPSKFPLCKAVEDKVNKQPNIAKWIETRPKT